MQSESQLRDGSDIAQRKKTIELVTALKSPPQKRSSQQANRIAQFLSTIPGVNKLTPALLNRLVHQSFGAEYFDGQIIYRASETATHFFIIVTGHVVLTDVKENKNDEGDDNVISRLNPKDWFGHEEILSSSRRAFTASALKGETFCIRVPLEEYSRGLEDIHMIEFDDKVEFISSLAPMRPLKPETVRKLAPCFSVSEFKAKDVVVRQGEKADAMYAIRTGSCAVVVDPHYKNSDNKLGTLEPGKTLRIVTLNPGAIIGDITVLATVTKRTASVIAATDVVAYKICRPVFLRRVPPDQLEILRRIANEKMKLTDSKIRNKPTTQALQDRILHGFNLRELSKLPAKGHTKPEQAEEYQELIHLLRRYKRAPVPKISPEDPAAGSGPPAGLSATMMNAVAAAASSGQAFSPTRSPPISSREVSPVRQLASPGHTGTEVAARLGAELDHEHILAMTHTADSGRGSDSSNSPSWIQGLRVADPASAAAAEPDDRVKERTSSPRSPADRHSRTRHRHSYCVARQSLPGRKRRSYSYTDNSPQHAGLPASSGVSGPDHIPRSDGPLTSRRADLHDVPDLPASRSVDSLESSAERGVIGRAVPLHGGQEDWDEEDQEEEQQQQQQQQQRAHTAGNDMNTGSAAVSAALSQHLGMDPHTGALLGSPPRSSQLSFAAPRRDVHSAQAVKHAQRNSTPGLAHLQGPPVSAFSDIHAPSPTRTRASSDGCSDRRSACSSDLVGQVGAGPHSASGLDRGALGLWSRPSSSVMQSRRLPTSYHTRPMSTSNTLRTIPTSTIHDLESRYGANSNSNNSLSARSSHHHHHYQGSPPHPASNIQGTSPASLYPNTDPHPPLPPFAPGKPVSPTIPATQTYPTLLPRPSVSDTHSTVPPSPQHSLYAARPASSISPDPRPSLSDTHPTLLTSPRHPLYSARPPSSIGHLGHPDTRSSVSDTHSTLPPQLAYTHAYAHAGPPSPTSLHPAQPPPSLSPEATVGGPVAVAQIARPQQWQQQQSFLEDEHSLPRFAQNLSPGDDRAPSAFHNQDPLGPIAYTHKPPAIPTQGPLTSMARLKGSASGPCISAAALASNLSTRESVSDGEKDDKRHGILREASAPYRPVQEGHGWSSSNLALPQHRTLAAAGGLERYLRQLQYTKELEKLQAMQRSAGRLDAALDKMAGPLLDTKANPMLRKGTAHYRPKLPKALL